MLKSYAINNQLILILYSIIGEKRRKWGFIRSLPDSVSILDIGCGNNSPKRTKTARPDVYYVGVDVGDYNQDIGSTDMADEYIIASPEGFATTIANIPQLFDAVISSHNIEHCNHPIDIIDAMCTKLKQGGMMFMAFPCEESAGFPSRNGTLNFHDDSTHIYLPEFHKIITHIESKGLVVKYATRHYRPILKRLMGGMFEILIKNRVMPGTWAYYGFESIIWAEKQ